MRGRDLRRLTMGRCPPFPAGTDPPRLGAVEGSADPLLTAPYPSQAPELSPASPRCRPWWSSLSHTVFPPQSCRRKGETGATATSAFTAQPGRGAQPSTGEQLPLRPLPHPPAAPTLQPLVLLPVPPPDPAATTTPAWHLPPWHQPQPPSHAACTASLSAPSPLTTANVVIPSSPTGATPRPP